jgi:putative restriction endonuclease
MNWTREEHILAFNLYCKIPFGTIHMRNARIIELARLLGRRVGSVSYKLANIARLDPALRARGIEGMPHGAKGEEEVWREFADHPEALAFESECLLAKRLGTGVEEIAEIDERDLPPAGIERAAIVRVRVNQSFFRRRIVSLYEFRCCVTGLGARELLVASHIIPWSEDATNRLNPKNGLCLNSLHDRAFDRRLMWIAPDYTVRFASKLHESARRGESSLEWLLGFEGRRLILPKKFAPDAAFLSEHARRCEA